MAEGLSTADGKPLSLAPPADAADTERRFAQSMAASKPGDADAPPRRGDRAAGDAKPSRARTTKGASKASAVTGPAAPLSHAEIVTGVQGLCQVVAAVPLLLSKRVQAEKTRVALKADAITIVSRAEEIADACAQTAAADPKFAALMTRVCQAGPYAALMTVAFSVGSQVARNHGMGSLPGTMDPAEMVRQAEQPPGTAPVLGGPVAHPAAA